MKGKKNHESRHGPRLRYFVLRRYPGRHRDRDPLRFARARRGSGRTVADPAPSSTDTEAACAGARLLCADNRVRDCRNSSRWCRARLWVPVRGIVRHAHLDLDQGHRYRPLNSATLTWEPGAPPKNWRALVNQSERFHIVGTWAAFAAFALFLTAVALKLAAHLPLRKQPHAHEMDLSLVRLLVKGRTQA